MDVPDYNVPCNCTKASIRNTISVFGWVVGEVRIDFRMPKSILTIFYDI